ncbi:MAG: acyltransferase [Candidatus Cloacimonetes bacterium]|nr:acyltransferase [Candidatus Cloacimonadota bacterium]
MKLQYYSLRPSADAEATFARFFEWFYDQMMDETVDNSDLACETLYMLECGQMDYKAGMQQAIEQGNAALQLKLMNMDPRNAALEPEYYGDVDKVLYARNKPFLWLWSAFDKLPISRNTLFAFPFRRLLGGFLFRHLGENVKLFHNIEITYGYNLVIEDNVVIHRDVLLDDRGGITIGKNASVSDYANIYSHTHSSNEIADVTLHHTVIGANARVTYHATVLSGSSLGEWSILGAMGLATRPIEEKQIKGGIPARPLGVVEPRGLPS